MERAQNINKPGAGRLQSNRANAVVAMIVMLHVIGAIGLTFLLVRPLFIQLVPYHLLLMMGILLFTHQGSWKKLLIFTCIIYMTGLAIEWTGVHTGWFFGDYTYVKLLGPRLDGIPLIIGVNWFLLIYATGVTLQRSRIKNKFLRLAAGAAILVLLDIFIEPVAKSLSYWRWAGNYAPFKNFVCWYIISFILLYVYEEFNFRKQSIVAPALLVCQFLFFAALQ